MKNCFFFAICNKLIIIWENQVKPENQTLLDTSTGKNEKILRHITEASLV